MAPSLADKTKAQTRVATKDKGSGREQLPPER